MDEGVLDQCPICQQIVLADEDHPDRTEYYDAAFTNDEEELIYAPEFVVLHRDCDVRLQQHLNSARDWTDAVSRARADNQKGNPEDDYSSQG